ncbi:MAG: 1-(5-phosphoribosyl)-5-[(5-phosphoribosylamino)methylideneamino]imidazole-4-carboxamide isomerase [Clostridiales bacterium]|jgi:phosphoribosylformimino-5-aminoimidazole carboxamide ribotide isomerase|nr:1-(5-phosphoribosyl)-5-[(5-phosphoribosylamino)methylideneamino]imidazole-4-carboxamide isomerase [Clostridiales bacterium]HOA34424.1 1-(5-phosphoribosyl)-5-[(5-phosphoribosylamino)methylideneamino]imidazole-4-carboxamide isomerase [Clostridiales bacterium]HOL79245.1 1-(5-phosphoribosyl)-5-[(5-phosphoribosylamino)methylideneamino]imidazole-4-carboxamide isomerase [Clostridiales bacterium]HPU67782.1 1-(5-phosphoribosyl)-5-[(5-phosphoribosylamino)methylideneamino]imidazole-4-carboxamide isomera
MQILPAIDLRDGKVVRLYQGDYDKMTVFGDRPIDTALEFKRAGAENLHLVDLEGAKDGEPRNFNIIADILKYSGLKVEVGGGIRTEERILKYLEAGARRVILGTAALKNFEFTAEMVKKYGRHIAVGVDAREGFVAVSGWLETSSVDSFEFVRRLKEIGVQTVIYTDIACDGASKGTNLAAYEKLCEIGINIIASGGISTMEELEKLEKIGAWGAILGKALYSGALDLKTVIHKFGG